MSEHVQTAEQLTALTTEDGAPTFQFAVGADGAPYIMWQNEHGEAYATTFPHQDGTPRTHVPLTKLSYPVTLAYAEAACDMTHTPPMDFASCSTHDETFPLGGTCRFDGKSPALVFAEEADDQRVRAVGALMTLQRVADELDTLPPDWHADMRAGIRQHLTDAGWS